MGHAIQIIFPTVHQHPYLCEKSVSYRSFPPAYVYAITQIKHKKKALLEAAFAEVSNMTLYI